MQFSSSALILASAAPLALAGNVCLSAGGLSSPGGSAASIFRVFRDGSPCDIEGGAAQSVNPTNGDGFCDTLPRIINICGTQATLVNNGPDPNSFAIDCNVALSINGVEYVGEVLPPSGDDARCDSQDCGAGTTLFGEFYYADVPMCT